MLACSALLIASFGCSNPGTVTAPDSTPLVVTSPNFIRILSASKDDPSIATTQSASAMISAQYGGTITNGRITLEFPAGALDQDTEITIDMLSDGTLGAEFGPHGTQFNVPVTMTMDLHGTTAEGMGDAAETLYYNEDTDLYELQPKVMSDDSNEMKASVRHFSRYSGDVAG
jgi:hypothetical protein